MERKTPAAELADEITRSVKTPVFDEKTGNLTTHEINSPSNRSKNVLSPIQNNSSTAKSSQLTNKEQQEKASIERENRRIMAASRSKVQDYLNKNANDQKNNAASTDKNRDQNSKSRASQNSNDGGVLVVSGKIDTNKEPKTKASTRTFAARQKKAYSLMLDKFKEKVSEML